MREISTFKKILISLFAIANISTLAFINLGEEFKTYFNRNYSESLSAQTTYHLQQTEWYVRRYAHIVGLDNKWQMFGHLSRFNWWYVIKGRYGQENNLTEVLLPLPSQSPRSFFERNFIDFKEAKFELNIYRDLEAKKTYSRYLCRSFAQNNGKSIDSITWDLEYQMILDPAEVGSSNIYLHPTIGSKHLLDFSCDNNSSTQHEKNS